MATRKLNQHRLQLASARKSFNQLHERIQEAWLEDASFVLYGMSFDLAKQTAEGELLEQVFTNVPVKAVQLYNESVEQAG